MYVFIIQIEGMVSVGVFVPLFAIGTYGRALPPIGFYSARRD